MKTKLLTLLYSIILLVIILFFVALIIGLFLFQGWACGKALSYAVEGRNFLAGIFYTLCQN